MYEHEIALADSFLESVTQIDVDKMNINNNLPPDKIFKIKSLIKKYKELFLWSKGTSSKITDVKHHIPSRDHPPIRAKQCPVPASQRHA